MGGIVGGVNTRGDADRVHARAPGWVTVFHAVGGVDGRGHHEIASAAQAVSVFEDVWVCTSDDFTVSVTGTAGVQAVPVDESNLALRAARLLASEAGITRGVHLDIHKGVPASGGMGGKSADAAAALVACDALWGTALGSAGLHELAARVGADVRFALTGGTAVGTGRAEQLSPALAHGRFEWVLVAHPDRFPAAAVYAELDEWRAADNPRIVRRPTRPLVFPPVLQALRQGDARLLAAVCDNDLQTPALRLRPELNDLIDLGLSHGALTGMVSGSGPTVAFLVEDETDAVLLQNVLADAGHEAIHVHGPVSGARLVR